MATYTGNDYKLRAASPMPVAGEVGTFVLHTFMAETTTLTIDTCTVSLPSSTEFKGQGGKNSSANYSRLSIKNGGTFQGRVGGDVSYVEEGAYGFV